jgi:hypothetical protein
MTYIVLLSGRLPVQFVHNATGRRWNVCKESEATRCESEDDARVKIVDHGMRGPALRVEGS